MIAIADLQQLIEKWQMRAGNPSQPFFYKNAIHECIYDVNQLINDSLEEEMSYKDFLEMEADTYIATVKDEIA